MRWAGPASLLAGVGAWALLGGVLGVLVGLAVVIVGPRLLVRLETASARRERLALIRAAPLVADLLAASLAAGVPLERAVPVIAGALDGPAGVALMTVHRRTSLGEPAGSAWSALTGVTGLGAIAATVARASRTGAPLAGLLLSTAVDLRAQASAAALAEVRATAVRAVLPLGLCLLPAFVLLGIVPVVGGLLPSF